MLKGRGLRHILMFCRKQHTCMDITAHYGHQLRSFLPFAQDLRKQLYSHYYLNFISPLSRALLEDLAQAALDANAVGQVAKVYDQYLNFVTLEDDLFVARHSGRENISYYGRKRQGSAL